MMSLRITQQTGHNKREHLFRTAKPLLPKPIASTSKSGGRGGGKPAAKRVSIYFAHTGTANLCNTLRLMNFMFTNWGGEGGPHLPVHQNHLAHRVLSV